MPRRAVRADDGHLLIVNPNTNAATTRLLETVARQQLEGTHLAVRGVTVDEGPRMIVEPAALDASVSYVVERTRRAVTEQTRGVIVGAIGDPGVDELRRLYDIPVVGIGEASVRAAAEGGRRFGMATSTGLLSLRLEQLVARHSAPGRFTGIRFTPTLADDLAADPEQQFVELQRAVHDSAVFDGAEAVIIGGGPLSESARRIAAASSVPIIEPVPSAIARLLAYSAA